MKSVSGGLASHLAQEVTTLTTCWELRRRDGRYFRFTDHVDDLTVGADLYRADVGYSRTAVANSSGLSVDNLQVEGVFNDSSITEIDLRNGLFDFAEVRVFLVNYEDLSQGILRLRRGTLGEVQSISAGQFTAELRGMAQKVQQIIGAIYTPTCRAQLGGLTRCKFPIDPPAVLRGTVYRAGEFVKAYTAGAPTLLAVPVTDGDFEAFTGWTTVSGTPAVVTSQDELSPIEGSNMLVASSRAFEITQDVDITGIAGFDADDLDDGFYVFQASVRRATSALSRSVGRVMAEALTAEGEVIQQLWDTGFEIIRPSATWLIRGADSVILPVGTRIIRFRVEAGNQSSANSKAAFDDLRAEIIDQGGVTGVYAGYENRIYECTGAGTTDASAPTFDETIGNTTVDGTVEWTARDAFTRHAEVSSVTSNSLFAVTMTTAAAGSSDDWFNGGSVIWETGANAGVAMEVRDYVQSTKSITLFLPMAYDVQVGDKLRVVPGCNRTREHCRDKFRIAGSVNLALGNMFEYDGEPDVPGPDFILTYPDATT